MTNRIFRAIFLVAAAVMLAVSLLTMGMMYQFSTEETTEKLQRETEYIACRFFPSVRATTRYLSL